MTITKLRFGWMGLKDPSVKGFTRWINGDLMSLEEIKKFVDKWQFHFSDLDIFAERFVGDIVEYPFIIDETKIEKIEVLDKKTRKIYQRII